MEWASYESVFNKRKEKIENTDQGCPDVFFLKLPVHSFIYEFARR